MINYSSNSKGGFKYYKLGLSIGGEGVWWRLEKCGGGGKEVV